MTGEPLNVYEALNAAELALVDYLAWRYQDVDIEGLPTDPLERWLWFVHGVADYERRALDRATPERTFPPRVRATTPDANRGWGCARPHPV